MKKSNYKDSRKATTGIRYNNGLKNPWLYAILVVIEKKATTRIILSKP